MGRSKVAKRATKKLMTPGSDGAIEKGCSCPVLDNCHGLGYMRQPGVFVSNGNCIIHDDALNYEARREYDRQNRGE